VGHGRLSLQLALHTSLGKIAAFFELGAGTRLSAAVTPLTSGRGFRLTAELYLAKLLNIIPAKNLEKTMTQPVTRLVIYRPKPGHADALFAILEKHGPTLRGVGLITDEPVRLYRARDLRREGTAESYFVEIFQWKDEQASDLAHQMPEVMAVWETMGPHMQDMTLTTLEPV
jgi:hypothetical protein